MFNKILYFFISLYCKIRDGKKVKFSECIYEENGKIKSLEISKLIGTPRKPKKTWVDYINELYENKKDWKDKLNDRGTNSHGPH